ncbi:N-acetyl-gamma-glutamyl-phosphate reductase [Buchnera aphidicola (Tetraneura ulmi)]|uniref:N-acetyl-gamma-glutamyl-phosphate reductase n=1 Tax=Buchnera aphidicola TaxID=9 RepID=UPI003464AC6C
MLNILIVGASGYSGVELVTYFNKHKYIKNIFLAVSNDSKDIGKSISEIHPKLKGIVNIFLESIDKFTNQKNDIDVVFLATDHIVSYNLVPIFISFEYIVFDLSGAYRIKNSDYYEKYYGFLHKNKDLLNLSVYGLPEWNSKKIKNAQLISLPGCYATCIELSIKPIIEKKIIDFTFIPVVNAISGVSGAGRNPKFSNSFCEVSLQPYNIFTHRHNPEIFEQIGGFPIIFIPCLGNFSRGILATITCRLKKNMDILEIEEIFSYFYGNKFFVRLHKNNIPSISAIIEKPFVDIGFKIQGRNLVIIAAEDNLLKGAASQAVQCFNIRFGILETHSLL